MDTSEPLIGKTGGKSALDNSTGRYLTWLEVLGIVGTLASLIGLFYAFIVNRRSSKRKLLVYDVSSPLALARVQPRQAHAHLSIRYHREGQGAIDVPGVYVHFVRVGNLGELAIRRSDIAPADPLRLSIRSRHVLDVALDGVSRKVTNVQLVPRDNAGSGSEFDITFDFLDANDGALIRVLTDTPESQVLVTGTIIEMPSGIKKTSELTANKALNAIGCGLAILLQVAAVAGALYIFRTVTGGWAQWWIFLLPIGALFLPAMIVAVVVSTVWPSGTPEWPETLHLPKWFRPFRDELHESRRMTLLRYERELAIGELASELERTDDHGHGRVKDRDIAPEHKE